MKKYLGSGILFIIGLYILTIILQSKSCNIDNNYQNSNSNPIESGYIPLENFGFDICSKEFDQQNDLTIAIKILIKDKNTQSLVTWSAPGVVNPQNYTKADLVNAGPLGATPNCIFSKIPGNKVDFKIVATAIGDCCPYCSTCSSGGVEYYGRISWIGESAWNTFQNQTSGTYLTHGVLMTTTKDCFCDMEHCRK